MVLLSSQDSVGALRRIHDEVCSAEQASEGHVSRGGRWLQRLEQQREAAW